MTAKAKVSCPLCARGHPAIWRGFDRWHSDGQEPITTYVKCTEPSDGAK